MIFLKNISKTFGERIVLKNINISIFQRQRIALVGRNGSGKSTLLKILAGIISHDEGKREITRGTQIIYFPQEIPIEEYNKTGRDLLIKLVGKNKEKVLNEINAISNKLCLPIKKINSKIKTLSGGEKSKLMLAFILKSPADIFLLDEPTNNLDLRGLILLENFIVSSSKTFLIVSHDKKFLDKTTSNVIDINTQTHNIEIYKNCLYSDYLKKVKDKEKREIQIYENYLKEKKRLEKTIHKEKQKAIKMQKGPKKQIDHDKYIPAFKKDRSKKFSAKARSIEKRMMRLKEIKRPRYHLPLNLNFSFSERSGDIVFQLKDVEKKYDNFSLGPLSLTINYSDRIAIIGPNGEGKTTLLRLLTREQNPDKGFIQIGSRVNVGYLAQEIIFNNKNTLLDYFLKTTGINESDARRIIARFGFFADDMRLKLKNLSPGKRSRFIIATLMAKETNCIILDEPSNHLDPEAFDHLEYALKNFKGTIIIVSHDRYLIDQIGITATYLMEHGKLSLIQDYYEYEAKILAKLKTKTQK